jgi:uncharacterized protein (DUF433 family)
MMRNEDVVVVAFSDEQTARLTGLSIAQLQNWDRTGFFTPSMAAENRRVSYSRVYSFADLLSLQVLKRLRNDIGCSLQHLREVKVRLAELGETKWSETTLYVLGKRVVFHDDERDEYYEPVSNQKVMKIPLRIVKSNMRNAVQELWTREEDMYGQTSKKRGVVHNEIVFAGTRITVKSVMDFAQAGFTTEQIMREFPTLTRFDIETAIKEVA